MCVTCDPKPHMRQKVSERRMQAYFIKWANEGQLRPYTSYDKSMDGIDQLFCNARRPDFFWDFVTWILIVECDEHQHDSEDIRCHHARNQDILNGCGEVPVYIIRFNPHAFRIGGTTKFVGTPQRMAMLLRFMQGVIAKPPVEYQLQICYMFYECTRCVDDTTCSYHHLDQFKCMLDYVRHVNVLLTSTGQKPGPSAEAKH